MAASAEKKERKFLGVALGDVIKIGVGGVVSFLIFYVGYNWNNEKPRIIWTVSQSAFHKTGDKQTGIFHVEIMNRGIKDAENLECILSMPANKIDSLEVIPNNFRCTKTIKEEGATIMIPLLGEEESITIDLMASNIQTNHQISFVGVPFVSIRGKGIRVVNEPLPVTHIHWEFDVFDWLVYVLPIVLILAGLVWYVFREHGRRTKFDAEIRKSLADVLRLVKQSSKGPPK